MLTHAAIGEDMLDQGTATQLITVLATLSGVILTLIFNAYQERRRARDAHNLESLRQASERANWLRDQRVKAYSGLSTAGEEVLQFVQSELPSMVGHAGRTVDDAKARWHVLRTDLRKAYNNVAMFGVDEAQRAGLDLWRTARNGVNDLLGDLAAAPRESANEFDMNERSRSVASAIGTVGERFLGACRKDLQG